MCLSVCLCVGPSVRPSVGRSVGRSIGRSVGRSVGLSVCLCLYLCLSVSVSLSVCLSVSLFALSARLFVCQPVRLYFCLHVLEIDKLTDGMNDRLVGWLVEWLNGRRGVGCLIG